MKQVTDTPGIGLPKVKLGCREILLGPDSSLLSRDHAPRPVLLLLLCPTAPGSSLALQTHYSCPSRCHHTPSLQASQQGHLKSFMHQTHPMPRDSKLPPAGSAPSVTTPVDKAALDSLSFPVSYTQPQN